MPLMKTSNPALGENTFRGVVGSQYGGSIDVTSRMTLSGTVNKTGILLICAFATAAWTWYRFLVERDFGAVSPLLLVGALGGFIVAMVTVFKKEWSPVTAPIYALLEGLVLEAAVAAQGGARPGEEVNVTPTLKQASGLYLANCRARPKGAYTDEERSAEIVLHGPDGTILDRANSVFL